MDSGTGEDPHHVTFTVAAPVGSVTWPEKEAVAFTWAASRKFRLANTRAAHKAAWRIFITLLVARLIVAAGLPR
jgi:hypothetical protein